MPFDISDFLDKLPNSTEAIAPIIIVTAGTIAWLTQRYLSLVVRGWIKRERQTDIASAIQAEIEILIQEFEKNFTKEAQEGNRSKVKLMHDPASELQSRPLITAAAKSTIVFETIRNDLTDLPKEAIMPVVRFYTLLSQFDASYAAQGTELFAGADLDAKLATIDETFDCSNECIKSGVEAIYAIKSSVRKNSEQNFLIVLVHASVGVVLLFSTLSVIRW